ncbi:MAG TPA: alpha/beta hydrolase [Verrucomicrobiae bacterium]|nr:alpha/beta hydrolase [Verrucomicrobiae bacterium]
MNLRNHDNSGYVAMDGGVRLYYLQAGQGARTLLVPNGPILMDAFAPLAEGRTIIFYDVRNRGRSDTVEDPAKLSGGIHRDVDDIETLRRHFGAESVDLIGHSYLGLMVALYAMKYPERAGRIVQIGPQQPYASRIYPRELTGADYVLAETFATLAKMDAEQAATDPVARCWKTWEILRRIYVTDAADVDKIDWLRCDLPNERNFRTYWMAHLMPSVNSLKLGAEDFARATAPVLTVHGRRDRAAPYGGGRDWAAALPNARLLTVENGGHAPWVEEPAVISSIAKFLDGEWPEGTEKV